MGLARFPHVMTFRLLSPLFLAIAVGVLFSACTPSSDSGGGATAATGDRLGTSGFLVTDYEPLKRWLDERFEVDYKHMTPQLIFDQLPLNDIFYETSNLPSGPPLNLQSNDISRRELLKKIANHWNLKMSLVTDETGTPTAVKVQG